MPNSGQSKGFSEISRKNIIELIDNEIDRRFDPSVVLAVVAVLDVDDVEDVL